MLPAAIVTITLTSRINDLKQRRKMNVSMHRFVVKKG